MNKSVSLAIEKAVGSISQKNHNELKNNGPKKTRFIFAFWRHRAISE